MDPQALAIGGFAIVSGPVLLLMGLRTMRMQRLIENTPTVKIRSMAMGLVEVQGKVECRSAIQAPFSAKPCVYWQVDISVKGKRDSWSTVHRNRSGNPFYLRDDTGVAMVYPKGLDARLRVHDQEVCHGLNLPDGYADYLREYRPRLGFLARVGTLRFREWRLEESSFVYLLGTATPRARVTAVNDEEAFLATGTDDPSMVAMRATRLRSQDAEVAATIRKGDHAPVFLMSMDSESQLAFGLSIQSKLMLASGPLLAAFGLWMLLSQ
ncbi:MAG: hypothetical protein HOP12_14945 [Candidatus Eisenbacteria bacterium]|uniref:RING-type E3 ubiquitin transferase n=1 Tax=Eiseniibacteriota bacterium TaxID=2212470 RepID=A0A849SVP9_UNCEI|nr:hypothetical protein [Candidatus Eisenbacteria bacterium]